jgi:hypothetical protein
MGSHSTDDMIPRVTVRSEIDAELLKLGLVELSKKISHDYRQRAAGADSGEQLALTFELNQQLQVLTGLLRAVDDGTMSEAPPSQED